LLGGADAPNTNAQGVMGITITETAQPAAPATVALETIQPAAPAAAALENLRPVGDTHTTPAPATSYSDGSCGSSCGGSCGDCDSGCDCGSCCESGCRMLGWLKGLFHRDCGCCTDCCEGGCQTGCAPSCCESTCCAPACDSCCESDCGHRLVGWFKGLFHHGCDDCCCEPCSSCGDGCGTGDCGSTIAPAVVSTPK